MNDLINKWVNRLDNELELDKLYGNADSYIRLRFTRSEATELRIILNTFADLIAECERYKRVKDIKE